MADPSRASATPTPSPEQELTIRQLELETNPWEHEFDEGDWRLGEVPEALFHVEPDVSPEIRKVVDEFRQQCEVVRASARSFLESAIVGAEGNDGGVSSSSHARTASDKSAANSEASAASRSTNASAAASSMTSVSTASLNASVDKGKGKVSLDATSARGIIFEEPGTKSSRTMKLKRLFKGKMPLRPSTSSTKPAPTETIECASCFDDLPSNTAVSLACTHYYCCECFIQLIQTSMQNENFWPPKCCLQEIPRQKIIKQLSDAVLTTFATKEREYATPAKDRWYCTRPSCGKWFEGTKVGNLTRCPHCNYEMCVFCRGEKHQNRSERCPQDKGRQLLDVEAELEGWRQCYSCLQMIELKTGCRHITCTCKAEFCYTCGARWRTCNCTEDDEKQRKKRLAALRDTKRKETAELEAALEAVAAAERREREHRILEEKRQMEEMERARVESIRIRFMTLRSELEALMETQLVFLFESQQHEKQAADSLVEATAKDQEALEAAVEAEVRDYAEAYKIRFGYHSSERNDAIIRHTSQRKKLETRFERLKGSMIIPDSAASRHTNALLLEQQKELNELWDQQRREVDRMESRLEAVRRRPIWSEQRARLLDQKQKAEMVAAEVEKKVKRDEKWVQLARGERKFVLDNEERIAVAEGEYTAAAAVASLDKEVEALGEVSKKSTSEMVSTKEEVKHQTKLALQDTILLQDSGTNSAKGVRMTTRNLRARADGAYMAESSRAGAARGADYVAIRSAIEKDWGPSPNGLTAVWTSPRCRGARLGSQMQRR